MTFTHIKHYLKPEYFEGQFYRKTPDNRSAEMIAKEQAEEESFNDHKYD